MALRPKIHPIKGVTHERWGPQMGSEGTPCFRGGGWGHGDPKEIASDVLGVRHTGWLIRISDMIFSPHSLASASWRKLLISPIKCNFNTFKSKYFPYKIVSIRDSKMKFFPTEKWLASLSRTIPAPLQYTHTRVLYKSWPKTHWHNHPTLIVSLLNTLVIGSNLVWILMLPSEFLHGSIVGCFGHWEGNPRRRLKSLPSDWWQSHCPNTLVPQVR